MAGEIGTGALDPRLRVDQPPHAPDDDSEDSGNQARGEHAARPGRGIDEVRIEIAGEGFGRAGTLGQAEAEQGVGQRSRMMTTPTLQVAITMNAAPITSRGDKVKLAQAISSRKNRNFGGRSAICRGVSDGTNGFGTSSVTVSRTALASNVRQDQPGGHRPPGASPPTPGEADEGGDNGKVVEGTGPGMNQGAPDRHGAERQGEGMGTQSPAHLALLGQRCSNPTVQSAALHRPECRLGEPSKPISQSSGSAPSVLRSGQNIA